MESTKCIDLSEVERRQLGTVRLRLNGSPSLHTFPPEGLWPAIRAHLVERSQRSNPMLNPVLTAYTPGETLGLLEHPEVVDWHERVSELRVAERFDTIVLVPCAKTKPWTGPATSRSRLYSAYNQLREEYPNICFATVSEPLGIVSMEHWGDFPQYDNPGLFRDDAQRSGLTTAEWNASTFGRCYGLPFDELARLECLRLLGGLIGKFLANHPDRRIIAVVDSLDGSATTHGSMLDIATATSCVAVSRHPKRLAPRVSPLPYLQSLISSRPT